MAAIRLRSLLLFIATLVRLSRQQYDPLTDFCRRFAHQTTVIDRKLYIDGGLANYENLAQNPTNYTNTWLLYADLDVDNQHFPQEYDNLTKSASTPSVQGGILWADNVNKLFYLYGGEYYDSPAQPFQLWFYDTLYDTWNSTTTDNSGVSRLSFGAGVAVDDRALGFYYGGWLSNASVPGWSGPPLATSTLLQYDMIDNTWSNNSGPDSTPRAEGVMLYIPASDGGMLVYFGGVQAPYGSGNSTWIGVPMDQIFLYDIANSKWYTQTATGDVPDMRRRFCAGATWAADHSSYNIYLYGGLSMPPNTLGFDDVYILSLPSFKWIKWFPTDNNATAFPHHSLTCNVIDGTQMIIMGGTFTNSSQCDVPHVYGIHNLNLGKQNVDDAEWYFFEPNITNYQVPSEIISAVGGGLAGGASVTAPADGWAANDLPVYFTRVYTASTRTPTRYIPESTSTPSSSPSPKPTSHTGAIVGGAVGGGLGLIAVVALVWFCLRKWYKKKQAERAESSRAGRPGTPLREMDTSPNGWAHSIHSNKPPDLSSISRHGTGFDTYYNATGSPVLSPASIDSANGHAARSIPRNVEPQELGGHPASPFLPQQHGAVTAPYFPPPGSQGQTYFPPPSAAREVETPAPNYELPSVRSPVNTYERDQQRQTQDTMHEKPAFPVLRIPSADD